MVTTMKEQGKKLCVISGEKFHVNSKVFFFRLPPTTMLVWRERFFFPFFFLLLLLGHKDKDRVFFPARFGLFGTENCVRETLPTDRDCLLWLVGMFSATLLFTVKVFHRYINKLTGEDDDCRNKQVHRQYYILDEFMPNEINYLGNKKSLLHQEFISLNG